MFNDLFNVQNGAVSSAALDAAQAEELAKTMTVGHGYLGAPGNLVGGGAVQMESVDGTLRSVTYTAENLVFWKSVPQDRAYSLVEQYIRQQGFGDQGSPYIPESGSPTMNDSEITRHAQKVVFMATRRGVSLPATLVRMNLGGSDLESFEAQSGTLWILERLERELYKGNADYSNNGYFDGQGIPAKMSNLNLTGLQVQIEQGQNDYSAQASAFLGFGGDQSVVFDREGELVDEAVIEDLANVLVENFSHPSEMHMTPKNMSDFIKAFYPKERVMNLGIQDGKAGYIVKEMVTTAGPIALRANVFLKPKEGPKTQPDRRDVPNAPASATAAVAADGDSKLKAGDKYVYEVASCNEQGESSATATSAQVTIANDGEVAKVTIASPAGGPAPSHYAMYRTSKAGSGKREFIGYVARNAANTIFTDRGHKIQGAAQAFMFDMRSEILVWKQLAPLTKIQLAQLGLAREFILWLAGTLIVFAPRKLGMIRNIGRA